MKFAGKEIKPREVEIVVIPRKTGNLVFKAQPVLNFEEFNNLCPAPQPPETLLPGGVKQKNILHPDYLKAVDEQAKRQTAWLIIKSLQATEELEWETVDLTKPETYENYKDELIKAGLSTAEINAIIGAVINACGLSSTKIEEATNSFLVGQGLRPEKELYQNSELQDMQSGEPANG